MNTMRYYGSRTITDLPAEIIDLVCHELTLEDIANMQEAYPELDRAIDFVFFPKFNKMRVTIDDKGSMVTLSPRSTHSYLEQSFSIAGDSPQRQQIIRSCTAVDSLTVSCSDHNTNYSILEAINRTDIALTKLVVNFHTPVNEECKIKENCARIVNRSHRKLTTFVREQSASLSTLKLSTSQEDSITLELKQTDAITTETQVHYAHRYDSSALQSLIYPLFNALNWGKPSGPSSVRLMVDWRDRLELALQGAFMVALPSGRRGGVRKMQIGFSSRVSSLTHDEIHSCLEAFSMQLSETRNLQELVCDFKSSLIDPSQLERTISILSSQLGSQQVHRIRVFTDAPLVEEPNLIKQEWAKLPPVY